jgi:amino acid permease
MWVAAGLALRQAPEMELMIRYKAMCVVMYVVMCVLR